MNQPLATTEQQDVGFFPKFTVKRTDNEDAPGGKHELDEYFVLNLTKDKHAIAAIGAYALSCKETRSALSADLLGKVQQHYEAKNEFVIVPETTLPGGHIEPSFMVSKYPCSKSPAGTAVVNADGKPWVSINYHESIEALKLAGMNLITETQWLAIGFQIYHQDENWTGGKVGEGQLVRGIHKDNVSGPQNGHYESTDPDERTWHVLANGERIYHIAGNVYEWVFDNVQGDENGIISKPFADDSLTKTVPPCESNTNGIGDTSVGRDWSGLALIRGGCWDSGHLAGVFRVYRGGPSRRRDRVGFRGTKSL